MKSKLSIQRTKCIPPISWEKKYYFLFLCFNFKAFLKIETNIGLKGSFLRSKKFGRETNFAWQNSEAVVSNPLSPVKFVSHTKCGKPASAELCLSSNQFERSESIYVKHGGSSFLQKSEAIHKEQVARGSSYHQSRRLIELKKHGGVFS